MKTTRRILSSFAVLVLTGCASMQVRSDYDGQASFARLGSYSWVDPPSEAGGHPAFSGPLLQRRVQDAVDAELARRGYEKSTSGTPDFRIASRMVAEPKYTVQASYGYGSYYGYRRFGHFGYGSRFSLYGHGLSYASSYPRESLEGTVILDIIDARNGEVIWRGWATAVLAPNPKPDQVHEYIAKAVGEILDEFPPERVEAPLAAAP